VRRARLAGDVLHDRDGALTHERDRHRVGAHTVSEGGANGRAVSPTAALDLRQQLVGVWKIESIYTETRTGGQRKSYGERPNGYGVLTREMRAMVIITAENRKAPATDADNRAAFQSMISYSGIYRVENDRFITTVDTSWNEAWVGTEQERFVKLEGDTMTLTSAWQPDPNTPGNPEVRFVAVWTRVKTAQ
jgi:Lipocalin-like domain